MHPQLQAIAADFESASARLERLQATVPASTWLVRPPDQGWSAAECIAHLNRTSEEFLPLMRSALASSPVQASGPGRRYRMDLFGWLLWRIMPPPVRLLRSRTTAQFLPGAGLDPDQLVAAFRQLQAEQVRITEAAGGLAIDRVHVRSPFDGRVRYNLFSCLSILPRHQHRHLWQAEQAVAHVTAARRTSSPGG